LLFILTKGVRRSRRTPVASLVPGLHQGVSAADHTRAAREGTAVPLIADLERNGVDPSLRSGWHSRGERSEWRPWRRVAKTTVRCYT